MLTSGRICMPIRFCQVAVPCILALPTGCKKRSHPWLPRPSKSRLLRPRKENTQFGLADLSCRHCPLFSKCGSLNKSMMNVVLPLFTENVFKFCWIFTLYLFHLNDQSYQYTTFFVFSYTFNTINRIIICRDDSLLVHVNVTDYGHPMKA